MNARRYVLKSAPDSGATFQIYKKKKKIDKFVARTNLYHRVLHREVQINTRDNTIWKGAIERHKYKKK